MASPAEQHRKVIIENIRIASQQLDKQIAFVAGGAFAIVAVFVDKIVPLQTAHLRFVLVISLACFAASIILALLANFNSINVHSWALDNEAMEDLEFNKRLTGKNKFIKYINFCSIIAILIGSICLIWFLSFNIYTMSNTENNNKGSKVSINIPAKIREKTQNLAMEVPKRTIRPTTAPTATNNTTNSDKK